MKKVFWYNSDIKKNCTGQRGFTLYPARFVFADNPEDDDGGSTPESPPDSSPAQLPENAEAPEAPESPETPGRPEAPTPSPAAVLQTEVSKKIDAAGEMAFRAKAEMQKKKEKNDHLISRFEAHTTEIQGVADLEKKSKKKTKEILEKLVREGKITMDAAQEILDLDVDDEEFESKWEKYTGSVEGAEADLTTIKTEAYEYKKIEQQFYEAIRNLNETLNEMGETVKAEAFQKHALDSYSRSIGFDLKKGKTVRFKYMKTVVEPDGSEIQEPIYRTATIQDVYFEDIESEDAKGNKIKVASFMPMVALQYHDEWRDKHGNEMGGVEFMTASKLKKMADWNGMVEVIEDRQDTDDVDEELKSLSELVGEEIKEGDEFEYREVHEGSDGKTTGINRKVRIVNVHKEEDEFFNKENSQRKGLKTTYIELDHQVVIGNYPVQKKSNKLTLGEFAKWKKRMEALKPISFDEARKKLKEENTRRNASYDRKSSHYPPIELKEGEMLYYDSDPPKTFVIKEIKEGINEIKLDNGSAYTATTFLAWVLKDGVEKKTAEAEAAKLTQHMDDNDPKKAQAFEDARKKAEGDMEKRQNPPDSAELDDDNKSAPPSVSSIRQLWNQTYFMSLGNVYAFGKEIYDFILRSMDRREKHNIGAIGHAVMTPIWGSMGAEFKALQQQAENERVQRFMQSYEQFGYTDLYNQLRTTSDRDVLKALLQAMSAKGWIRWDDPVLWGAISRVGRRVDASFYVDTYDEEKIAEILDALWGDNSYLDFRQKNDGAYKSKKSTEMETAARFENDPSGRNMKTRLQDLLKKHLDGEFVDPAQYEGYLEQAISAGKLSFADKVYFMLMGLGAAGPAGGQFPGRTLMDLGRVGAMAASGSVLRQYPIIEYFAGAQLPLVDENGKVLYENGEPKIGRITQHHINDFIRKYIEKDAGGSIHSISNAREFTPGEALNNFIEREIFYNPEAQIRILKASADVGYWDHDDFHELAPHLNEEQVAQLTATAGGGQKASPPAIRNALVGFNHFVAIDLDEYMKGVEEGDTGKASKHLYSGMQRLLSFVRLHAILDRRYYHTIHDRTRLRSELKAYAGVDQSRLVTDHISELNQFMRGLIGEMMAVDHSAFKALSEEWDVILSSPSTSRDKQNQENVANRFSQTMSRAMGLLTERVGEKGVYDIIARVQGKGSSNDRLIKGIQQRTQNKEESAKIDEKLYKFEFDPSLLEAKDTVDKIDQLTLRLQTKGPLTSQQLKEIQGGRLKGLMERIRKGKGTLVTDDERQLLDSKVSELEQQVGPLETVADNEFQEAL